MITTNKFIWKIDYYAYHITNTEAMKSICREGLKPSVGERSKLSGDNISGIFFFNNLYFVNDWIEKLYKDKNICELELLRFNLKELNWIIRNPNEFYLNCNIMDDKIEYLRIYNKKYDTFLPINKLYLLGENELLWKNLKEYKPLFRRKELL